MSKETNGREATKCACGGVFAFPQYHWPHCPMNPVNLDKTEEGRRVQRHVTAKFSKGEIAAIAAHGPVRDERLRSRRRGKS